MAKKKTAGKRGATPGHNALAGSKAAPAGAFTEGMDTSDIPDIYVPELRVKDREGVVIRFCAFKFQGKTVRSMRGQVHRLTINGKYPTYTCAGPDCPLCTVAGSNPSFQWFAVALLRGGTKTISEYNTKQMGKALLVRLGKKAVKFIEAQIQPTLDAKKLDITQVDLIWSRLGNGVDTQHIFNFAPKQLPLTSKEKSTIAAFPDLFEAVKPQPIARLMAIATQQSGGVGVAAEAASAGPESSGEEAASTGFDFS